MIEVSLYKGRAFSEGATLCIKHRLYVPGWSLLPTLRLRMERPAPDQQLAVAFNSATPVALVLYTGHELMAFCRKDHRRKGYGSACLKKLTVRTDYITADEGISGSFYFWQKNDVLCHQYFGYPEDE